MHAPQRAVSANVAAATMAEYARFRRLTWGSLDAASGMVTAKHSRFGMR